MKARAHPDQITQAKARLQLKMLLTGMTDKALAEMPLLSLQRSYKVPPREVEAMFLAEHDKRRRRNEAA